MGSTNLARVYDNFRGYDYLVYDDDPEILLEEVLPASYTDILLVEDDETTSQFIKYGVNKSSAGPIRVRSFFSGEKAYEYISMLKKYDKPGPDLAIVDYMLTGVKDGLWFCGELKNKFPETQTVLTSTLSPKQIREKMDSCETKPFYLQKPLEIKTIMNFLLN